MEGCACAFAHRALAPFIRGVRRTPRRLGSTNRMYPKIFTDYFRGFDQFCGGLAVERRQQRPVSWGGYTRAPSTAVSQFQNGKVSPKGTLLGLFGF